MRVSYGSCFQLSGYCLLCLLVEIKLSGSSEGSGEKKQQIVFELRTLSWMRSFISHGKVQKRPHICVPPLSGDGSSLHSFPHKSGSLPQGLNKMLQQSFQTKAETQIECWVFFQVLPDSFGGLLKDTWLQRAKERGVEACDGLLIMFPFISVSGFELNSNLIPSIKKHISIHVNK